MYIYCSKLKSHHESIQRTMKKVLCFLTGMIALTAVVAQNYQITFTGSGMSSTVGTVKVWNLTTDTVLTMSGSDTLRLVNTSGIEEGVVGPGSLSIFPNPASRGATVGFRNPKAGNVSVQITDMSGRLVLRQAEFLPTGQHAFSVESPGRGMYWVTVDAEGIRQSGKVVFAGESTGEAKIRFISIVADAGFQGKLAATLGSVNLPFTAGDQLMFRGSSGNYARIVTLVPTQSQVVDFEFVACTDGSNNNYAVVTIGTQTWMAENLRTSKYRTGGIIPKVVDDNTWMNFSTPAFTWYNHDSAGLALTYGALYKWYTASQTDLCPTGWHVPTRTEWSALISYLGGDSLAGGKLKETGLLNWNTPNAEATNSTGFTGRPGGLRTIGTAAFIDMGDRGYYWSATDYSAAYAYCYQLDFDSKKLHAIGNNKGNGFSVRCVKD
jgi:uncharacterized protein (TIGR02145 family)